MTLIALENIEANPCRDLENFKFIDETVEDKIGSIGTTGWWKSVLCRPKDNEVENVEADSLAEYLDNIDHFAPMEITFELAYGHHRIEAIRRMFANGETFENIPGIEVHDGAAYVDIQTAALDNPTMLRIMANENKDDTKRGSMALLETLMQTQNLLAEEIVKVQGLGSFEEYEGGFFSSEASFNKIKSSYKETGAVGYRQVLEFLTGTWSDNDVQNGCGALAAVREGLVDLETISSMPSTGVIKQYVSFVRSCMTKEFKVEKKMIPNILNDWPETMRERLVRDMADLILCRGRFVSTKKELDAMKEAGEDFAVQLGATDRPTVRTLTKAVQNIKSRKEAEDFIKDPITTARTGSVNAKFNPAILLKEWVKQDIENRMSDLGAIFDRETAGEVCGLDPIEDEDYFTLGDAEVLKYAKAKGIIEVAGDEDDGLQDAVDGGEPEPPLEAGEVPAPPSADQMDETMADIAASANLLAARIAGMTSMFQEEHKDSEVFTNAINELVGACLTIQDKF